MPNNNQQSVDLAVLRQLREIASPHQVDELIDLFFDTLEQNFNSMRSAVEAREMTALARLAHGSKGTAAGMGATSLAELSRELEGSAKRGMLEEVYLRFKQMESEAQRIRQIFGKEKTQPST
jgi:HPt (histidine-containing phosphotransfer) domain-containing protein